MKIHNFEQHSPEWYAIRKGKMTASEATAIGNCGAGLDTYINNMMAEYYSSAEKEQFNSDHTNRGNEYEPVARKVYEFENDVEVQQVGFIEHNEYVGFSPDGLVGEEGGWENKAISDEKYFEYILNKDKKPEKKHVWQCQMGLLITGRKWWDLMYYNPNYSKSCVTFRIYPDKEMFEALEKGFAIGIEKIENIKSIIEK